MNTLKSFFIFFFLLQVNTLQSQGFYLKPSIAYGVGLSKQEIRFNGFYSPYIQNSNYKEDITENGRHIIVSDFKREAVPLGKGKVFEIELGYESKKFLYYTLSMSYGMMDKFLTKNVYEYTEVNNVSGEEFNSKTIYDVRQIVSPIWYGLAPGIGIFKNFNNYKLLFGIQAFTGLCRIRIIEVAQVTFEHSNNSYNSINEGRNFVFTGSNMYGGSTNLGIERKISKRSCIGIKIEYRNQIYTPSKKTQKRIYTYYNVLGSVVPDSKDASATKVEIKDDTRSTFNFESISLGLYMKLYLTKKNEERNEKN